MSKGVDSAKLWQSSVPGIELFKAQFFNHTFAKHMHETYTIGLNYGGQGRFIYRGEVRCAYPNYLIRSFHQQIGLPPHSFQMHVQLLKAKRELKTSKPVSEVAIEHGFYDQSHLTRHFKRVFGITPGHYRQVNFVQDS